MHSLLLPCDIQVLDATSMAQFILPHKLKPCPQGMDAVSQTLHYFLVVQYAHSNVTVATVYKSQF